MAQPPLPIPDPLPGVIQLEQQIAKGGYADVYVGFWKLGDDAGELVCVKCIRPRDIKPTSNLTAEERFERVSRGFTPISAGF